MSGTSLVTRLGDRFARGARRWVPEPFLLALLLTVVVFALGAWRLLATGGSPAVLVPGWVEGFSSRPLLAFALQMCLVLVTGHALATSPPVQRVVVWFSRRAPTAASASALVAFVSCLSAVAHWGLGAIVGAFLAREMGRYAKRVGRPVHYPLLGAAAYSGFAVWHGGFSGSAPLKVAEQGHFVEALTGVLPVSETLFSPLNLIVTGTLVLLLPVLFYVLTPSDPAQLIPLSEEPVDVPKEVAPDRAQGSGVVGWLQHSKWVGGVFGLTGFLFVFDAWMFGPLSLDLDLVNLLFLFIGLSLQGSVVAYAKAVTDGAKGAGGIVLQFPFYFGILGVMKAAGMIAWLSDGLVSIATQTSFPALAFLSAGVVNLFVPSGGGQWAVQGEVLMTAAHDLGVDPATAVMAFSYGDAWTNMLQPFWALPLLGIMRLEAKDIVGYTAIAFLVIGIVVPTLLTVFG